MEDDGMDDGNDDNDDGMIAMAWDKVATIPWK